MRLRQFRLCAALFAPILAASVLAANDAPTSIPNLDDVKKSIIRYHDSGRWDKDSEAVVHRAERWIASRSRGPGKLALVLDIDETALLNWPEELKSDFGYIPSMWSDWEKQGKALGSPEILELFKFAKAHRVLVFFVTGRHEDERDITAQNLANVGYRGYLKLLMKPNSYHNRSVIPFKSDARATIEKDGYRIIANVGDQWSDLKGGHSERDFKMPNPMYFIP